ncbi:MAG: DJ-1/PfpI family protein [Coriobacteriales bacterium]|nr:DJ-1/PfpI family protein [Coriobacteriales bacterium]
MKKVAVMLAPGYEEGEALMVVDIIRRGGFEVDAVGLLGDKVTGGHGVTALADTVFDGSLDQYDMVVLPGGYDGAAAMRDHDGFLEAVRKMDAEGKWVCAICAAPIALDRAGLLDGRRFTCYPTTAAKIAAPGATWVDEVVLVDGNRVYSQGPGTTFHFAYALVDVLGGNADKLREAMLYNKVAR